MPTSRGTVILHASAVLSAARQAGVVSRQQLLTWGWTSEEIQGQVRAKRWRRLHRGIYWTATGPTTRDAVRWAAILGSGSGAVLCGHSAAEVWGFGPPTDRVFVAVPRGTRPRATLAGVCVTRFSNLPDRTHPRAEPPRTTVEDTVLDLVEESKDDTEAIGWITRALQARKTHPKRLLSASLRRARLRRRSIVEATCGHYGQGATTPLEIGWLRRVERPHGLPRAERQARDTLRGRTVFRDLGYLRFALYIELDGRLGHEGASNAFRDMQRDNAAATQGRATLRYGWTAVMADSCEVAAQVADVLRQRGWDGNPRSCGPECSASGG